MTKARIEPFCRANTINLGHFDGIRVLPRLVSERNIALFLHNNHFCLIWKSQGVHFNKTLEKLERNFKTLDIYITAENVNSQFKYDFIPKKIDFHLTNFLVYDLETQNTDRARPYCISF